MRSIVLWAILLLADLKAVGRVYAELPRDLLELLISNRELIDLENPAHE